MNQQAFVYWRLVIPVAIIITSIILGFVLEKLAIKFLRMLAAKTQWPGDEIVIKSFRHLIIVWCVLGGLYISLNQNLVNFYLGELEFNYFPHLTVTRKVLTALVVASITLTIARLASAFINYYRDQGNFPVSRAFDRFTLLVICSVGVIAIVNIAGFSTEEIYQYILPFAIVIASIVLAFIIDQKGFQLLQDLTRRTEWEFDDLIVQSFDKVTILWPILGGIFIAVNMFPLPNSVEVVIIKGIIVVFLASATIVVYRLAINFIQLYTNRGEDSSPTITSLFEVITKLVVFSLGFLVILQSIGISITPLITALGIGGVSIGLALKGPLENLTSGITIISSKKVRPGDYIKLSSGEEGYVTDVELKYTVIRRITGNLQVIPNAQLIGSSFTNYGLPERKMLVPVELGVSYDSDLEKVEEVTLEVAREVITEILSNSRQKATAPTKPPEELDLKSLKDEPFLCYSKFDYYSINFTVFLKVEDYFDQLIIKHKFIKKLYKRYQQEGIVIPFPIKTPYVNNGDGLEKQQQWNQINFDDKIS